MRAGPTLRFLPASLALVTAIVAAAPPVAAQPPSTISIGGFRLESIQRRADSGSAPLDGSAVLKWAGDSMATPIRVDFEQLSWELRPPAGAAVMTQGTVRLAPDAAATITLAGHRFEVRALELSPSGGHAVLGWKAPRGFAGDGLTIEVSRFELRTDGAFVASGSIPATAGDLSPDGSSASLAARVLGATLVVDLSTTAVAPGDSAAATWTGVALRDCVLRLPVRPPDGPGGGNRDLFATESSTASFLYAEAPRVEITPQGRVQGTGLRVRSSRVIAPFFGQLAADVWPLFSPAGFGLEIEAGTIDLADSSVTSLDLSGHIHLPAQYSAGPIAFLHLRRGAAPNTGLETEELRTGLPRLLFGVYSYHPEAARLRLRTAFPVAPVSPADMCDAALAPPATSAAFDAWERNTRDGLDGDGLLVWGGVLAAPWEVAPAPPEAAARAPAPPPAPVPTDSKPGLRPIGGMIQDGKLFNSTLDGRPLSSLPLGLRPPRTESRPTPATTAPGRAPRPTPAIVPRVMAPAEARVDIHPAVAPIFPSAGGTRTRPSTGEPPSTHHFPVQHAAQAGAFLVDGGGPRGQFVLLADPEVRKVGEFSARIDSSYFHFCQSTLVDSAIRGRLLVPYPASLEIGFRGSLSPSAEILVPDDGLDLPAADNGWYLDYWKMSLFPNANVSGGRGRHPAAVFTGDRILIANARMRLEVPDEFGGTEFTGADGRAPFSIALAIRPTGQIDDIEVRPSQGGDLLFLGVPFQTSRARIDVRRYVGDHVTPAAGAPKHPGALVELEGTLAFELFGERAVRIRHTAMGARVPFVAPTARDAAGNAKPVLADSEGAIYVDARLKFLNTFGMPASSYSTRFPPRNVDPNRPFEDAARETVDSSPFKAFVGEGRIEVVDALSVNGLAEAGVWLRDGRLQRYEKIGVGGGVDVLRALLAGLHGMETVAHIGGGIVEITTGAKGLGAEVIHVVTDAVGLANSIATTALAAAGTGATAGGATPVLEEEVRHLVGEGLSLTDSSLDLAKEIYKQRPFYEPTNPVDPTTDPPYVAMEVADIVAAGAQMGVQFEEIEPEKVAALMLQTLDTAIPIIQRGQLGDRGADQKADLALALSRPLVRASRSLLETGTVPEETAWLLAGDVVEAGRKFRELDEVRARPESRGLPLAIAVAAVSVDLGRAIRLGEGSPDVASLVDLVDQVLVSMCEQPGSIQPIFDAAGITPAYARSALAGSRAVFHGANRRDFLTGSLPPPAVVSQVILPTLDAILDGTSSATCGGPIVFEPVDGEVRAMLRVARQVLRVAEIPTTSAGAAGAGGLLAWSMGVVAETMRAVNVLRPGSVDARVVDATEQIRAAAGEIDPTKPAAAQLVRFAHGMMPAVRSAVESVPGVDPAAAQVVDVVREVLAAAAPAVENGVPDAAQWLDGSRRVVREAIELPLPKEARVGLGVAAIALELSGDGARGRLSAPKLIAGARGIVDTLRLGKPSFAFEFPAEPSAAVDAVATPSPDTSDPALDVAAAALGALEDSLPSGRLTLPGVGDLLASVGRALAPSSGGRPAGAPAEAAGSCDALGALGAALRGLPIFDPSKSNADAAIAAQLALLDAEERGTSDVPVRTAVQKARAALLEPAELVLNAHVDEALLPGYDPSASGRRADAYGGVRERLVFRPSEGEAEVFFHARYPVGHPRHDGGLEHTLRVPAAVAGVSGNPHTTEDLDGLEEALIRTGVIPESRSYQDAQKNRVRFVKHPAEAEGTQGAGEVTVLDAVAFGEFHPTRRIEVTSPPSPGQAAGELHGILRAAAWREAPPGVSPRNYAWSGGSVIRVDRFDVPGAWEFRAMPGDIRVEQIAELPKDGHILRYHGDHPSLAIPGWTLDWREGETALLVHDGRSYDLVANNALRQAVRIVDVPIDGALLERRRHDPSGTSWLWRPRFPVVVAETCGNWRLRSAGPLRDGTTAPAGGDATPPLGEAIARGDASGRVFRADGASLTPEAARGLGIVIEGSTVQIVWGGDVALQAGGGKTVLLPGSDRASEATACLVDLPSIARWLLGDLWNEEARSADGAVRKRRHEAIGDRFEEIDRFDESFVRRTNEQGLEEVTVGSAGSTGAGTCAGAIRQSFAYDADAPAIRAPPPAPLLAAAKSDPRRAAVVAYLNRFERERQEFLVDPSILRIRRLVALVESARREGWLVPGMADRAAETIANALSVRIENDLDVLQAARAANVTPAALLSGSAPNDPVGALLTDLGHAEEAGLDESPRVAATFARSFAQNGVVAHPLDVVLRRVAPEVSRACGDTDAALRARGALRLAIGLHEASTCDGVDPLVAQIAPAVAALADAQNACLQSLVAQGAAASPDALARAQETHHERELAAGRLGVDPRPVGNAMRQAMTLRLARATAAAADSNRSAEEIERFALPALTSAAGDSRAMGIDSTAAETAIASAAATVAKQRTGALDRALAACPLEEQAGCRTDTLEGCRLDRIPTCSISTLRTAASAYVRGISTVLYMANGAVAPDDVKLRRALRLVALAATDEATRAGARGDAGGLDRALTAIENLVAEAAVLGIDITAILTHIHNQTPRLLTLAKERVALSTVSSAPRDEADGALRYGIGLIYFALQRGIEGVERDALKMAIDREIGGLQARQRSGLQAALLRDPHDAVEIEQLVAAYVAVTDAWAEIESGQITGELGETARGALIELFRTALSGSSAPRAATLDPGFEGWVPDRYARFLLLGWLANDDPAFDGRARAKAWIDENAARHSMDEANGRRGLVRLAGITRGVLETDRELRRKRNRPAIAPGDDILVLSIRSMAQRLADELQVRQTDRWLLTEAERRSQAIDAELAAASEAANSAEAASLDPEGREALARLTAHLERLSAEAQARVRALDRPDARMAELERLLEIDRIRRLEEDLVVLPAEAGLIESPEAKIVRATSDRFAAAAAALDPVRAQAGPHLRLAHRLASRLASPLVDVGAGYRFGAAREMAGFLWDDGFAACPGPTSAGGGRFDVRTAFESIFKLAAPAPGELPGRTIANVAKSAIVSAGGADPDPATTAGLQVGAAAIDGAVAALFGDQGAQPVDWLAVMDAAAASLAQGYRAGAPPGEYWTGLAGRIAKSGLDLRRNPEAVDAFARTTLDLTGALLEEPNVRRITDGIPPPGGSLLAMTEGLVKNTLADLASGDPLEIALARVFSHAAFDSAPAPAGPLGLGLSGWALDFAQANRALLADPPPATAQAQAERLASLTRALVRGEGVPRLTCAVNEAIPGANIPGVVALAPIATLHGLVSSPGLLSTRPDERAKVLLDGAAEGFDAWLASAEATACPRPAGLAEGDAPFAASVRALKEFDPTDPRSGFEIVGRFGLGAVDAFAPGATLSRALNTLWWGRPSAPVPGVPYVGLGSALSGETADVLELAIATPKIAGDVVAILSADPNLEKTMRLFAGECRAGDLLPPDTCRSNTPGRNEGTIPNLLLATLGDLRRGAKANLTPTQHRSDPGYGYLRSLAVLKPGEGGLLDLGQATNRASLEQTIQQVANLEHVADAATRATLAAIDLSRMAVNGIASLPAISPTGTTAQQIRNQSVFAPQVGAVTFSGTAGGLVKEWELGSSPAEADLYFELAGQFVIPGLLKTAAQLTYQNEGDDWMFLVRGGGNHPDLTAIGEQIGVRLPLNELTSPFLGRGTASAAGWLGAADGSPYVQLFATAREDRGAVKLGEFTLSGFAHDFHGSSPAQVLGNLDVGACYEAENTTNPLSADPAFSVMTLGLGGTVTTGAYFFKLDGTGGFGVKAGLSSEWNVPVVPIAGLRLGVDVGSGGEGSIDIDDREVAFALHQCVRPYVSASFFGLQLEDLDINIEMAEFARAGSSGDEAGIKMRFRIAEEYIDTMKENLGCGELLGPVESALCSVIEGHEGELVAWIVASSRGLYFGLGRFPENGDLVPGLQFNDDGELGGLGLHEVKGWGGFTASPFDTCSATMCGSIDDPPPGARVRPKPPL